ncbi:hypothetical protein D3C71_1258900 [compost metagenome]
MGELAHGQRARFEILGVGPHSDRGALLALARLQRPGHQGFDHVTGRKHQACRLAFAVARCLQPCGQCVGHTHAHAVQAAREAVGAALALVELATRVQPGEHQFDHRGVFLGVHAKRNAPAVVLHADRAVGMQRDADLLAVPGQRLVGRVVQHLLNDVQGVVGAGVHARALLDGLQALEHADRAFGIFAGGCRRRFGRHGADCSAATQQ